MATPDVVEAAPRVAAVAQNRKIITKGQDRMSRYLIVSDIGIIEGEADTLLEAVLAQGGGTDESAPRIYEQIDVEVVRVDKAEYKDREGDGGW